MAFTVTSPKITCAVTATTAIANIQNSGAGVYAYITYTGGDETGIYIYPSCLQKKMNSTKYWQYVKSDSSFALTPLRYSITADGDYRIPITTGLGEGSMKLTFAAISGTANGSIAVDISGGA